MQLFSEVLSHHYVLDTGRGFWLSESDSLAITLNKKWVPAPNEIVSDEFHIRVTAASNRCINRQRHQGGRLTFSVPQCLFLKTVSQKELSTVLARSHNHGNLITQRAPGRHIRLSFNTTLSPGDKCAALALLAEVPIFIQLLPPTRSCTNRLRFRVVASSEWSIT